jgi:hypothetical protein
VVANVEAASAPEPQGLASAVVRGEFEPLLTAIDEWHSAGEPDDVLERDLLPVYSVLASRVVDQCDDLCRPALQSLREALIAHPRASHRGVAFVQPISGPADEPSRIATDLLTLSAWKMRQGPVRGADLVVLIADRPVSAGVIAEQVAELHRREPGATVAVGGHIAGGKEVAGADLQFGTDFLRLTTFANHKPVKRPWTTPRLQRFAKDPSALAELEPELRRLLREIADRAASGGFAAD